jgi:raffinose/stachyose/melibiose transport system permease protein
MARSAGEIAALGRGQERAARRTRAWTGAWTNYLYVVPLFLLTVGLLYYAIAYTIYTSLLDWNGISRTRPFAGLDNFRAILRDDVFYRALRNTVIFGVLAISIQMVIGLTMAILLKSNVRWKAVYKVVFFLPVVLSPAVIAYVFRHIYEAREGALNRLLEAVGAGGLTQAWLADPDTALYAVTVVNIWQWTSFSFVLYFAGLSLIDDDLYEAARLDGANFLQLILHITVPMLRFTHISLVILGAIGALKTFDIIFLTTGGGPGRSTEFLSTYIFEQAIQEFDASYSAALSVVLILIAVTVTAIQLRIYRDR